MVTIKVILQTSVLIIFCISLFSYLQIFGEHPSIPPHDLFKLGGKGTPPPCSGFHGEGLPSTPLPAPRWPRRQWVQGSGRPAQRGKPFFLLPRVPATLGQQPGCSIQALRTQRGGLLGAGLPETWEARPAREHSTQTPPPAPEGPRSTRLHPARLPVGRSPLPDGRRTRYQCDTGRPELPPNTDQHMILRLRGVRGATRRPRL